MNATGSQSIRQDLLKTQKQITELLGISLKAVQSFEQGWRSIPPLCGTSGFIFAFLENGNSGTITPLLGDKALFSWGAGDPPSLGI